MISSAVKSFKAEKPHAPVGPTVLEIRLNKAIRERSDERGYDFNMADDEKRFTENSGLNDIIADIHHAATDNAIKGIYLNLGDVPSGLATVEAVRNELIKFKETSHKFIIAYGSGYSQKSYYLASVADKVYLYPEGEIFLKGLSAQIMFYKKALDKLGVQVQVFRHGRYKSFVEPFILDKMSPDNRLQTRMLLSSVWNEMLGQVAKSRGLTVGAINQMCDSMSIRNAEAALNHKLVDGLHYPDEVMDEIRGKLGIGAKADISFIGLDDYRETFSTVNLSSNKIAVIYAAGDIVQGNGGDESIGGTRYCKAIQDARLDPNVKAIVLRINSPGGDALASDMMWREIDLAKKSKPIVVSMGDYAASGGYYMACDANSIVAEPTTITGSIGVFGLLPNAQQLLNDKLGITIDTVSTNTHAAAGSLFYPLSSNEMAVLQGGIENFYHTFLTRVADGRKMTTAQVDSIAQGRVWSADQAIKIGLVDTLGGLDVAINIAAKKANLTTYAIKEMPRASNPFRRLLARFGANDDIEDKILQDKLGDLYTPVQEMSKAATMKGMQARMPYQLIIE